MVMLAESPPDLKFSIAPDEEEPKVTQPNFSTAEEKEKEPLTDEEIKETAEKLIDNVNNYFGPELTKRIFENTRNKGKIELVFNKAGSIYGKGGLAIITSEFLNEEQKNEDISESLPYIENTLRQPWRTTENNFENSYISLQLEPRARTEYIRNFVSDEDLDSMRISAIKKASTTIKPEEAVSSTGEVNDEKIYSMMKHMIRMRLARGTQIKEFNSDKSKKFTIAEIEDLNEYSPLEIKDLYYRMYPGGSAEGGDIDSLKILNENVHTITDAPENIIIDKETPSAIATINHPEENPLIGLHPSEKNIAQDLIEPAANEINNQIEKFNSYQHKKQSPYRYRKIKAGDMDEIVNSTLYKDIDVLDKLHKKYPDPNLVPLVLSDDVLVFRGQRGVYEEDIFVLLKNENRRWEGEFFLDTHTTDKVGRNLSERIDDWMKKLDI